MLTLCPTVSPMSCSPDLDFYCLRKCFDDPDCQTLCNLKVDSDLLVGSLLALLKRSCGVHPHLTIIICRAAVWAQACGSESKTSFVIIVHLWFIRCPRSFLDPCWCVGGCSFTILPLLVQIIRTCATVTTPVRCVLVNTLQYHDTVDFCASIYLPTGYEPKVLTFGELNDSSVPFSFMIPSSDQDMDDVTLGKLLTEAHRGQADYCEPEGVSVSQSSSSVVFDRAGKPAGKRNFDQSVGFGVTRNTYSAHSKFSENTLTEKMVDRSGQPDERNSSNAQIRTLLEEQRQTIIAEYREKVGHHELQAAPAEEERRLLQEELWRQKLEFRVAHRQSLTEMEGLRKFQSSTFDTIARRRLIEDQNTILELSGRVQELQNEVNCMNDSKDFQDAESVRSGNSHVTSRPVSFPTHPIPEGMLRHSFVSPCRTEGPLSNLGHTWYIAKRFFCRSTCNFISSLSSRIESMEFVNRGAAPFIYNGEK